ncbi:MAG TPA: RNA polymerase sigma factor [Vicinamibacterales bacterium]
MSRSAVTAAVAHLVALPDSTGAVRPFDRDDPAERALVSAARAGDREAFGELVTRHERVVFRTALAALGRSEDAEEASQEAFLVAWQKLPGFRGDATFRTWLLTIVWRKALDRRRIRALWWRRTSLTADTDATDPVAELPSNLPTPERSAVSRDTAARVEQEIHRLSPKLRDALVLAASGEHSYPEIAAVLGIPLGTVKWRVSEARRVLTERLEGLA